MTTGTKETTFALACLRIFLQNPYEYWDYIQKTYLCQTNFLWAPYYTIIYFFDIITL
jgi:hypothetical protein